MRMAILSWADQRRYSRFKAVKAAVWYYLSRLPPLQQEKVKQCLEILELQRKVLPVRS
jgi:hypothetical protein